jgi:histidine ammonia-lyase
MMPSRTILLGETPLRLRDVEDLAHRRATLDLTTAARDAIAEARVAVDRLVETGTPAYGITTGVGSQKDFALSPAAIASFNDLMITAHATLTPAENAPAPVVRAAMAIQLSLFARGHSGIRLALAESLLARFRADDLPTIRLGVSVGVSDIVSMAQMAVPLLGKQGAGPGGAGPKPIGGLAAKEALSLLASNSLMLAHATLVLAETRALLDAAALTAALSMEGFRGNLLSWSEPIDTARGQPGQTRAGAALRAALTGSRLWQPGEARLLQDPLSFRCVPQIHGAAVAAYDFAHAIFETELSAVTDNPLIDPATGSFIPHCNSETTVCALAMDMLRQALAKVIETAGQRIHKIQWPGFTGLPTSLAAQPGAIGGVQFLNLGHLAGAHIASVLQAAHPALLNFSGQMNDGVEDVGGNTPHSVAETMRALPPAWNVLALEAACAVWAIHRRDVPLAALGEGLQALAADILRLLPIGTEGAAIFDVAPIVHRLQGGVREVGSKVGWTVPVPPNPPS